MPGKRTSQEAVADAPPGAAADVSQALQETVRANSLAPLDLSRAGLTLLIDDLAQARIATLVALRELSATRPISTHNRGSRLQRFCGILAGHASQNPIFRDEITAEFVLMLTAWVPFMDVGHLLLHDSFIRKPGRLTPDEREAMQEHTILGSELLRRVGRREGKRELFEMPVALARSHHERYDGTGYPDGLVGMEIPLAARIAGICDTYDAMRSQRSYKPAKSHEQAVQDLQANAGYFDPHLVKAFSAAAREFAEVWSDEHRPAGTRDEP